MSDQEGILISVALFVLGVLLYALGYWWAAIIAWIVPAYTVIAFMIIGLSPQDGPPEPPTREEIVARARRR